MSGCDHCWHATQQQTFTGGIATGRLDEKCCHCGIVRRRHWHNELSPDHGPYMPQYVAVFDDDPMFSLDGDSGAVVTGEGGTAAGMLFVTPRDDRGGTGGKA